MSDLFAQSLLARRAAALSILALLLFLAAPLLAAPFSRFGERAEAIATETALLDRLGRLDRRRAAVASLAALADPPFLVAPDAGAALDALQARLVGIVSPDTLRIESVAPLPREEKPGAPVEISVGFAATEAGLYAVLADLETRPPFVRVRVLAVKATLDEDGRRVIAGSAVLSAVPLLTVQP